VVQGFILVTQFDVVSVKVLMISQMIYYLLLLVFQEFHSCFSLTQHIIDPGIEEDEFTQLILLQLLFVALHGLL
jgi:hypothetical protein